MGTLAINTDAFPPLDGDMRSFSREMARRAAEARKGEEFVGPPEEPRTPPAREGRSRKGLNPLLLLGPLAGAGADAYTTDRYFDTARELDARPDIEVSGHETNPVLRGVADNDGALYGIKGGTGLGISLLAEILARKGHRNLAKGVAIAGTVVPLALAGNNFIRTEQMKKAARQ